MSNKTVRTTPRISDAINRGVMTSAMKKLTIRDHECLTQVIEALDNQDFKTALRKINRITEKHSHLPDAYAYRGCIRFNLGNFHQGLTDYERCLSLDPNYLGPRTMDYKDLKTELDNTSTERKKTVNRNKSIPQMQDEHIEHFKNTLTSMHDVLRATEINVVQASHLSVDLRKMLYDKSNGNCGLLHIIFPEFQLQAITSLSDNMFNTSEVREIFAKRKGVSVREWNGGINPVTQYSYGSIRQDNNGENQSIDAWMNTPVMRLHGIEITIQDLVKTVANKHGAHADIRLKESSDIVDTVIHSSLINTPDIFRQIFDISDYLLSFLVHSKEYRAFCQSHNFAYGEEIATLYSRPGEKGQRDYKYFDEWDSQYLQIDQGIEGEQRKKVLKKISDEGDETSMTFLAYITIEEKGFGDADAVREGLKLYEKATCLGHYWAQYICAQFFLFGDELSKETHKDLWKAFQYCKASMANQEGGSHINDLYKLMKCIFNDALNKPPSREA